MERAQDKRKEEQRKHEGNEQTKMGEREEKKRKT